MNSCSDEKPQGGALDINRSQFGKNQQRIRTYFPSIFFGICFLAAWVWRMVTNGSSALDALVILAATVATLLVMNQRLPMQNVLGAVVTIAIFWWITLLIEKVSGIFISPPLFKFHFLREFEFGLFWVVGIINARGIIKLILRRVRKSANFGLWLIALSSLLLVIEDSGVRKSLIYFAEKFVFTAVVFVAATPWFIDKKKAEPKPDYQPLLITILLMLW